jgi:hypothetical protein
MMHGTDAAAAAVAVHDAVDAAAAMQSLVQELSVLTNIIKVDAAAGSVSFRCNNKCTIFSLGSASPMQFVEISGLPPSFTSVPVCVTPVQPALQADVTVHAHLVHVKVEVGCCEGQCSKFQKAAFAYTRAGIGELAKFLEKFKQEKHPCWLFFGCVLIVLHVIMLIPLFALDMAFTAVGMAVWPLNLIVTMIEFIRGAEGPGCCDGTAACIIGTRAVFEFCGECLKGLS